MAAEKVSGAAVFVMMAESFVPRGETKICEQLKLPTYHCSHMGPHLETRVPMGTFFSFWVPIGTH